MLHQHNEDSISLPFGKGIVAPDKSSKELASFISGFFLRNMGSYSGTHFARTFTIKNGRIDAQDKTTKTIAGISDNYNSNTMFMHGSFEEFYNGLQGRESKYFDNELKNIDSVEQETTFNIYKTDQLDTFITCLNVNEIKSEDFYKNIYKKLETLENEVDNINDILELFAVFFKKIKKVTNDSYDICIFLMEFLIMLKNCDDINWNAIDDVINEYWFFDRSKIGYDTVKNYMDIKDFSSFSELSNYVLTFTPVNRRSYTKYTLKYHNDNLYDSITLDQYINKFIEINNLKKFETSIKKQIFDSFKNKNKPKVKITVMINISDEIEIDKKLLEFLNITSMVDKHIITKKYILNFENFISRENITLSVLGNSIKSSNQPPVLYYTDIEKPGIKHRVSLGKYFQYTAFVKTMNFLLEKRIIEYNDVYKIFDQALDAYYKDINKITIGNKYTLTGFILNDESSNSKKRLVLKEDNEPLFTHEYNAVIETCPRIFMVKRLAKLVLEKKEFAFSVLLGPHSGSGGLYTHQIEFIDNCLKMAFVETPRKKNTLATVVYNGPVGSGKTTSVVLLARAINIIKNSNDADKLSAKFIIYATGAQNKVKREIYINAKKLGLNVLSSYKDDRGGLVIKTPSMDKDNDIKIDNLSELEKHDLLVCDIRILLKLLAISKDEDFDISKKAIIIMDEIITDEINSSREHQTGAIFAYKPKMLAVLSASIKTEGPINYYKIYGDMKIIESSEILVPTYLKQFNREPIDLFAWNDNITKNLINTIGTNTFLKRFVNYQHIETITRNSENGLKIVGDLLERNIFDASSIFINCPPEIHNEVYKKIQRVKQDTENNEDYIVKSENYYTLVACKDPIHYVSIYSDVIELIGKYIKSKYNEYNDIMLRIAELEKMLSSPKYSIQSHTREILEISILYENDLKNFKNSKSLQVDDIGVLRKQKEPKIDDYFIRDRIDIPPRLKEKLTDMTEDEIPDKLLIIITGILSDNKLTRENIELLRPFSIRSDIAKNGISEDFSIIIREIVMEFDTKSAKLIKDANNELSKNADIKKLHQELADRKNERNYVNDSIAEYIEKVLKDNGFMHKYDRLVEFDYVKDWISGKKPMYIYDLLGIYVDGKSDDELLARPRLNRIFADASFSKGVDFPIESVIITEDYAKSNTIDTILQTTGRSGRPGKSNISNVYMSPKQYIRIFNDVEFNVVQNAMLRTKFYLLTENDRLLTDSVNLSSTDKRIDILMNKMHNESKTM